MGNNASASGNVNEKDEQVTSTTSAGPMVRNDSQKTSDAPLDIGETGSSAMPNEGDESGGPSEADSPIVPTVFKWELGGREVFITGTFNGWCEQIPMHQSGNDFTYIHDLSRGRHAYKFIVDGQWRFAPDQPTVSDVAGHVNNFIDVSDFKPGLDVKSLEPQPSCQDLYGQRMPDDDDCAKEPPPLPPHLRHNILNKVPPPDSPAVLPVPQHVALNHLYCTAIKDSLMVLGITSRYKEKYVTTIYYSVMPEPTVINL